MLVDERRLAQVGQHHRGQHHGEPGEADRSRAKVAAVGVQRLGAGDRQHDRAEREERGDAVIEEEAHRPRRREALQDLGVRDHLAAAENPDGQKPDEDDRAEQPADRAGAEPLGQEQADEDHQRDRDDQMLEARGGDVQALDGGDDRDRRGDHAVPEEQAGAEDAEHDQHGVAGHLAPVDQRGQGHDPAVAAVVGSHDDSRVLERDDDHQAPEDQ